MSSVAKRRYYPEMNRFLWERRISVWELPIVTLIIGTIVSQSIIFLSTIIMGKLYSPGQFGVYALIVNIAGVLALFLSRSLETFIVPAGTADEANSNLSSFGHGPASYKHKL